MSHFREVCEFGKTHSQCRCPSKDKEVREVVCNMLKSHSPSDLEAKPDPAETIAVRTAWTERLVCVDATSGRQDRVGTADTHDLTVLVPRAAVEALFAAAEPVAVEVQP